MIRTTDSRDGSRIMLREGDQVSDGNATPMIAETGNGMVKLEYTDGDTLWLQDNRFYRKDGAVVVE